MLGRITTGFLAIPKKAATALAASIVLPGAGQIYNREVLKGILLWAIAMGFLIWGFTSWQQFGLVYAETLEQTGLADIATAQAHAAVPHRWLGPFFYLLVVVYSALDAWVVARQVVALIERERLIREAERRDAARGQQHEN